MSSPLIYSSDPSLLDTEVRYHLLNSLLIGLLTTFISYQVAGAVFDLFFGFKPRRKTTFTQVQTLLLVRQASPLAVITNLFKTSWLQRLYYVESKPEEYSWGRRALFRLVILLLAAPIINIISIILTIEASRTLTYKEAGAPNVAYGIHPNLSVYETKPETSICNKVVVGYKTGDSSLADLTQCYPIIFVHRILNDEGKVQISSHSRTQIKVFVQVGNTAVNFETAGFFQSGGEYFMVRNAIPESLTLQNWFDEALELLYEHCPDSNRQGDYLGETRAVERDTIIYGGVVTNCARSDDNTERDAKKIARKLISYLTFIPNPNGLELAQINGTTGVVSHNEYVERSDLNFLTRRTRTMGLVALSILAAAAFVLRAMSALLLNNDIDEGIELSVKGSLGVGCCESMLRCSGEVTWEDGRVVRQRRTVVEESSSEEGTQL